MNEEKEIQKIRDIRAQIAKECDYDFQKICELFRSVQNENIKKGIKYSTPATTSCRA